MYLIQDIIRMSSALNKCADLDSNQGCVINCGGFTILWNRHYPTDALLFFYGASGRIRTYAGFPSGCKPDAISLSAHACFLKMFYFK